MNAANQAGLGWDDLTLEGRSVYSVASGLYGRKGALVRQDAVDPALAEHVKSLAPELEYDLNGKWETYTDCRSPCFSRDQFEGHMSFLKDNVGLPQQTHVVHRLDDISPTVANKEAMGNYVKGVALMGLAAMTKDNITNGRPLANDEFKAESSPLSPAFVNMNKAATIAQYESAARVLDNLSSIDATERDPGKNSAEKFAIIGMHSRHYRDPNGKKDDNYFGMEVRSLLDNGFTQGRRLDSEDTALSLGRMMTTGKIGDLGRGLDVDDVLVQTNFDALSWLVSVHKDGGAVSDSSQKQTIDMLRAAGATPTLNMAMLPVDKLPFFDGTKIDEAREVFFRGLGDLAGDSRYDARTKKTKIAELFRNFLVSSVGDGGNLKAFETDLRKHFDDHTAVGPHGRLEYV